MILQLITNKLRLVVLLFIFLASFAFFIFYLFQQSPIKSRASEEQGSGRTIVVCPAPATGCDYAISDPANNGEAIQQAVNAAQSGDTVLIMGGDYRRTGYTEYQGFSGKKRKAFVHVAGKDITLLGRDRPVLNGKNSAHSMEGIVSYSTVTINGLVIQGMKREQNYDSCNAGSGLCGLGYAIVLEYSAVGTITNNSIVGNYYGITLFGSSSATIKNNTISGNELRGIDLENNATATITNNIVMGNKYQGIALFGSSSATIKNNTISGNEDAGIYLTDKASATAINNISSFNKGVGLKSSSTRQFTRVEYNIVYSNGRNWEGFGLPQNNWQNDPLFRNRAEGDYRLALNSPARDKGEGLDPDGTQADLGAFGGEGACGLDSTLPGCQIPLPTQNPTPPPAPVCTQWTSINISTLPGSGTLQTLSGYFAENNTKFVQFIWRNNVGYERTIPVKADGSLDTVKATAWSGPKPASTLPGQGDMQTTSHFPSRNGAVMVDSVWRGGVGWVREVPISNGWPNLTSAPAWTGPISNSTFPGSGVVQTQSAYYSHNGTVLNHAIWRGNQGWTRTIPVINGVPDQKQASAWSGPMPASNLPGQGDMQATDNVVVKNGSELIQGIWRGDQGWVRTVPMVNGVPQFSTCPAPAPVSATPPSPAISRTPTPTLRPPSTATPTKAVTPQSTCPRRKDGDATCDGVVDLADFDCWNAEFSGTYPANSACKSADFNGSGGKADLRDYEVWRKTYTSSNYQPRRIR